MASAAKRKTQQQNRPQAPREITQDLLDWAKGWLYKHYGEDAVEYSGLGLYNAQQTFDPSRGVAFKSWATVQLKRTFQNETRRDYEDYQKHGPRHEIAENDRVRAGVGSDSLHTSGGSVDENLDRRDFTIRMLATVNQLEGTAKNVAVGKIVGQFSTKDISIILGMHITTVRSEIAQVRKCI